MTQPLNFTERAKLAAQQAKAALAEQRKANSQAATKAQQAATMANRIMRWQSRFDAILTIAESDANLAKRQRAANLLVKLARFMEGRKQRSASETTVRGIIQLALNGQPFGTFTKKPDAYNAMRHYAAAISGTSEVIRDWASVNFDREFPKMAKLGFSYSIH